MTTCVLINMELSTLFVLIFSFSVGIKCDKVTYDNCRVYSIHSENDEQLTFLQGVEVQDRDLLFLTAPLSTRFATDVVVPPHKLKYIDEIITKYGMKNEIKTENLQSLIDAEQPTDTTRSSFGWERYNNLTEIYAWLDDLVIEYSDVLTNYNFGKSYENRTLRAVKLSYKTGNPTIFIESNIHAREWATSATATFILNEFLTSQDEDVRDLAESFDWVFVPVFNVDGFEYTHSTNRLWRKTRSNYGFCTGVDPNRNFEYHHAESGSSWFPCSEIFAGPTPFSEVETKALSEFIKTFDNIKIYMSFHSYSQLLLFPYGHSKTEKAPNYDDLNAIAAATTDALSERYGTEYEYGDIATTIYEASGSSIDWVYGRRNVSLTYTYEFRDKGKYGFILPADQIIPNSLEVLDSLQGMVEEARALGYL